MPITIDSKAMEHPIIPFHFMPTKRLATTLERLFDFGVLLIKSLASLFRERVLETVRGVVSSQNVNGRVEGGEGGLSSNLGKTTVIRNKVNHFLLHILAKLFHLFGSLGQTSCNHHVTSDAGSIVLIVVRQTPIRGEGVVFRLLRYDNLGQRYLWEQSTGSGNGTGRLEKVTTSRLRR